jgi:uncharacterized protein (TIGR02246 family)
MRPTLVPSLLLVALTACAGRVPLLVAPAPAAPRAPEEVDRLFGERLNAGDVDGVVALYEPGATLVRGDRSAATGHPAIRTEIAGVVALRPRITMNVTTVLRGGTNLAVLYNDWHATATDRDGKPLALRGRATEVVRRQRDGSWRLVIDDPNARDPR